MTVQSANTPAEIPRELDRWNWGAFFLNWIWGLGNSTYIALLMFVPLVNIIMIFVLGARGSAWAWKNKPWRDVEHFKRVQKAWAIWGLVSWIAVIVITVGFTFWIISTVSAIIKQSEPYKIALEEIRANAEVAEVIGDNITDGFLPTGSINFSGSTGGEADIGFSITGSKGKGTVSFYANRRGGSDWDMRLLVVRPDGGEPIVIVNKDSLRVGGSVGG
jgi:hypothetical protein